MNEQLFLCNYSWHVPGYLMDCCCAIPKLQPLSSISSPLPAMSRCLPQACSLIALLIAGHFFASAKPDTCSGVPTCLRAIYRLDYKIDSAVATPKRELMILRITKGVSCFMSQYKFVHDSTYSSLSSLPFTERANTANQAAKKIDRLGRSESRYAVFKEPAKDLVFYHDEIGEKNHQYQEKAPLFHWQLTTIKKVVAGYECQQAYTAFGGRIWEAWFTRDIPVSEGPYKFYGLPGLIVKVRDTHDNYGFELLSFESNPKPFAISTSDLDIDETHLPAIIIKKAKFKQAKLNADQTFLDRMASWGNYVSDNMRQDYAAKLKRRNNPLELK